MIKITDFQGDFQYESGVLENNYFPFGLLQTGYNKTKLIRVCKPETILMPVTHLVAIVRITKSDEL